MTQEETLEYNKRCAEVLGYQVMSEKSFLMYEYPKGTDLSKVWVDAALVFHSDWNWIMEVLQKIEDLNYSVEVCNIGARNYVCYIRSGGVEAVYSRILETKKEAVVQAINQFLIWYNENKTN
jgi:hypothetical protein